MDDFETFMWKETKKEIEQAYLVLNEMIESFTEWFPFDETYSDNDKQDAENAFARTKLCLELGEYSRDDYEC